MAGRGPAPQDVRRRRAEPARGEWVDLPELESPVLPELPERDGEPWSERTRLTWEAWRADPVSAMWSPSDVAYAVDTIWLYESMRASGANEVRLRMDGLGLTPKGKRDLRWRVGGERAEAPARPARASGGGGRRSRLSVVQ